MRRRLVRTSKFLSLVLRHDPERIGITLDEEGWASVPELLAALERAGHPITRDTLAEVVSSNEKKRFALSADGSRIRARQGHSVAVDLGLRPVEPPKHLLHGTAARNLPSIRANGLVKGSRQHVHLSPDEATARAVGQRHGRAVVLIIDALRLARTGAEFFLSENGVWLTDHVPVAFIVFPDPGRPHAAR